MYWFLQFVLQLILLHFPITSRSKCWVWFSACQRLGSNAGGKCSVSQSGQVQGQQWALSGDLPAERSSSWSLVMLCSGLVSSWCLWRWYVFIKYCGFQQHSIRPCGSTCILQLTALLGGICLVAGYNLGSEFYFKKSKEAQGECPNVRLLHVAEHRAKLELEKMLPQLKKQLISIFLSQSRNCEFFPGDI